MMKGQDIINLIEEYYLNDRELAYVSFVEPWAMQLIFDTTRSSSQSAKSYVGIDITIQPFAGQFLGGTNGCV